MIKNNELEYLINKKLNSIGFNDCCPNGLQVEGRKNIQKIVTGVTACQDLLNEAVHLNADAVIAHHGYFWKKESPVICNMKRNRLKTLLVNDINLYSWHLPLDIHPELGNNIQLANILDIIVMGEITQFVLWGKLLKPVSGKGLISLIEERMQCRPQWYGNNTGPEFINHVAWCTGGGQDFIDRAASFGVNAFITGEVFEQNIYSAVEQGIHLYAAGHHVTERYGILALSKWISNNTDLEVIFIDTHNPILY